MSILPLRRPWTAGLVALLGSLAAAAAEPTQVVLVGNLQKALGCPGDWDPACTQTALSFDVNGQTWQKTFRIPAGSYEYKVALNGSWDENYGAKAAPGGANIPLVLAEAADVKLYYSHATHWVADGKTAVIATAPGSYQKALGCSGDWDPACLRSWLQDPQGSGSYSFSTKALPKGDYEAKAALGESWTVNYGAGGVQNGPNIPFNVPADGTEVFFVWNGTSKLLTIGTTPPEPPQPASVGIPGSYQSKAGCAGDWDPACAATQLVFDDEDRVWQKTIAVPKGDWEYKAALNGTWDENYGQNATRNGPNIPLGLAADGNVKFYFSRATSWVTSSVNSVIATVPGSFQKALGCKGDWDPACLRSWLQDPHGDGVYTFTTQALPKGSYEAKVAINESWDENYGAGGVRGGPNIAFSVGSDNTPVTFTYDPVTHVLKIGSSGPKGSLAKAQAHFLTRDTVAWKTDPVAPGTVFTLHTDAEGGLKLTDTGVEGGQAVPLTVDPAGLSEALKALYPHLASYTALKLPATAVPLVPGILKGQIAVSGKDAAGALLDATSLQVYGALDDLYANDAALGVTWAAGTPTLRLWAPTARSVKLQLFDGSTGTASATVPMTADPATGVWSVTGLPAWSGKFYLYEVEVYVRTTGKVETNVVTDPYSVALAKNSTRSQIVDLSDPSLVPAGWSGLRKPPLASLADTVLYELHVRDFSWSDQSVPEAERGTFKAFTRESSSGMQHLASLARAGVTHVHLLPAFDFATVEEERSLQKVPPPEIATYPPDSEKQQELVTAIADQDGFNWGYDPFHYDVPEGSYSTRPDGPARTLEFREMVAALARAGLRVVMDVVYNHTSASGQDPKSVLDRIVPGYYHRLNADGNVESSTCCANTASEHRMMEKLMVDSVVLWAREYKVDGFRFDLMGHHMVSNMVKVRDALRALTPEKDGVDGSRVYVYGEAWDFGEVAGNARGVNAVQANIGGLGIGSFNDRERDGARGGGPFSPVRDQGFLTGLSYDPNGSEQGSAPEQRLRLLHQQDWIKVGASGGLADYTFVDATGATVKGSQVDYNGQKAGYTLSPIESVNYVSAHDNQTLFDSIQLKAPARATLTDRVRMQNLGLALLLLGQGIPFIHAGDEILRSKSMDNNSYNSGDWFNRVDFTYETSSWGSGLPVAGTGGNKDSWPIMKPLLADPTLKPAKNDIRFALDHFLTMAAIRTSSPLFRLETAGEVSQKVRFPNAGPEQVPGLVVMTVTDAASVARACRPPRRDEVKVVLWNARDTAVTFKDQALVGVPLRLDPHLEGLRDPEIEKAVYWQNLGTFRIPARTTLVYGCGRFAD